MNLRLACLLLPLAIGQPLSAATGTSPDELALYFLQPPDSAKAHTWWHWMNGNVTKEGITADLEAMKRVGIGGAQIFNAAESIPHGPVQFNSPEWRALVKYAAQEADRLGLELCIHNCAGWSSSGGPWNTPEHAMQVVVTSEVRAAGPARFEGILPQPPTKFGFYRDIAVLAFHTPPGEAARMQDFAPRVSTSTEGAAGDKILDGDKATAVLLPLPKPGTPQFIQFEFSQPYAAQQLVIASRDDMQGCNGLIEISEDGKLFREIESFSLPRGGEKRTFVFNLVAAKIFRVLFTEANPRNRQLALTEMEFSPRSGIEKLAAKSFVERGDLRPETGATVATPKSLSRAQVVDLTDRFGPDGKLTWDMPAGEWTILRLGHTPTGAMNRPAPVEGTGLECDKLSRAAVEAHWAGMMGKLIDELGPLAGKALNNVLIDSYEVGSQNWTPGFSAEFQKRAGYDILPFLPVLTGRVMDSPEITERFLWDFRRVIADLFAENYSGVFAELAHKHGMLYSVEPYGNGPSDDLQYGSHGDINMSEFWAGGDNPGNAKLAAAVAHVHGQKIVGAESFTAWPEQGKWLNDPFSLKALGDVVWCGGVNRFIFHRYAMQPWTDPVRNPGMTMGPWGMHFERTTTWWEQSRAWLLYIARSQYLLQQGLFVADICYFSGDGAPNTLRNGPLPPGYDYDGCSAADLKLMSVKNGRIVLPDGMSYRMLVLPSDDTMTPATLRKLKELADAGALIVGRKPTRSPSLANYPACDEEVRQLAASAKFISDQSPAELIASLNLPPDFEAVPPDGSASIIKSAYIHRVIDGAEVYFVSNRQDHAAVMDGIFRVGGRTPEFWHPDTGRIEEAPVWREAGGRTVIPLRFDPAGSVFVVFRKPVTADHIVSAQYAAMVPAKEDASATITVLKAEYGMFGPPLSGCVDVTAEVQELVTRDQRRILAGNQLAGDPSPSTPKELRIEYVDGGKQTVTIKEGRTVELPAKVKLIRALYGVLSGEPPASDQTVDVTAQIVAQIRSGRLLVKVSNELAGSDPAPQKQKALIIKYRQQGTVKTARVAENRTLVLPEDQATDARADYELQVDFAGKAFFLAWQPGKIAVQTVAGRKWQAKADEVPGPIEVAGPWQLLFPPDLGAPVSVSLPKLISWTEHADRGVKYFSGTACYRKEVEMPVALFGRGLSFRLNLGLVRNLGEVIVNGRALGILWKPPFGADITDAIRPGKNTIEIRVTNLWPNRLIGDEQLPDDREWEGTHLKAWPKWILEGKPSPTGRVTFTTWHHWKKDDALLPSGLLGPVTISCGVKVDLK